MQLLKSDNKKKNLAFTSACIGEEIYAWVQDLFPVCRSISGAGLRETLLYLNKIIPNLNIISVPSGKKVFDWVVPEEWNIRDAWIKDENGNTVIDFKNNNLHIVGYSIPFSGIISHEDLQLHLHSLAEQPDAIPYVTSYYERRWGFCLSHNDRVKLNSSNYQVHIDSDHKLGEFNYGEVFIPGLTKEEVFISTYICHPSMANNELSGPAVTAAITRWILSLKNNYYSYRVIFIPETIGSLIYLSEHLDLLKKNVKAGFNLTCIGDNNCYSYLPSKNGATLSDKVALNVLQNTSSDFKKYTWLERGSDERQYCSPGVDLPIASIMRSKYHEYPEYHTSLDDMSFVSKEGFESSFILMQRVIQALENNFFPKVKMLGEPFMTKRKVYPTLSAIKRGQEVEDIMNLLTYSDGNNDLIDISNIINIPTWDLIDLINQLSDLNLIELHRMPNKP